MTRDEIIGELNNIDRAIKASHRLLNTLKNVKFEPNVAIDQFFSVKQVLCRLVAREHKLLEILEDME